MDTTPSALDSMDRPELLALLAAHPYGHQDDVVALMRQAARAAEWYSTRDKYCAAGASPLESLPDEIVDMIAEEAFWNDVDLLNAEAEERGDDQRPCKPALYLLGPRSVAGLALVSPRWREAARRVRWKVRP